jgi:hypothetical protein
VIRPIDITRSAWLLIKHHGDQAEIEAAAKADEFLAAGNLDGLAVWQAILRQIVELRRTQPTKNDAVT